MTAFTVRLVGPNRKRDRFGYQISLANLSRMCALMRRYLVI